MAAPPTKPDEPTLWADIYRQVLAVMVQTRNDNPNWGRDTSPDAMCDEAAKLATISTRKILAQWPKT